MKTFRFISTFVMLALATVVTVGSMYVTVTAAAQQESTESTVAPPEVAPVLNALGITDAVPVPGLEAAISGIDAALDKSMILRGSQSHVILDEDGGFKGRLSSLQNKDGEAVPAANLNVTLAQHGVVIGSTTSDAAGQFSFTGLPEGVVAIWAEGEDSLSLFSIVLFAQDTAIEENAALVAAQVEFDVDSAVAFGADIATVKELMSPSLQNEDKRFATEVAVKDQEFDFGAGEVSTTVQRHRVRLQNDGSLKGEANIIDERTGRVRETLDLTVHFVKDGVNVASSEVANDGSFIATGLSPGVHSIVAVGQDGIMVTAVDLVGMNDEDNQAQGAGGGQFTPVSVVADSLTFSGSPVGPENVSAFSGASGSGGSLGQTAMSTAPPASSANAAEGGSSSGTGGGGGGGGGAGGGGFGLLLGGIAGAVGYLAGQSNNDTPASPGT